MAHVFMFPGQGSQEVGMGEGLFERFADVTAEADDILGYSVADLCLNDPNEQIGQTQFTQPALYTANALSYLAKVEDDGVTPDYVIGHSLGEYNALFAAGAVDFATGLKLVQQRGALMSQASGGGMAAVLGLAPERIQEILAENGLDTIDMANYNAPTQTVISGLKADIEAAEPYFEEARMYVKLKVSGAFHSRYMADARDAFAPALAAAEFGELTIPCIANCTAEAYTNDNIADGLASQISSSVRWTETVNGLLDLGDCEFAEVGPKRVLGGLLRQIQRAR
jgi:trans-AT polyketide synthase/acyltransferase/oxidoreductase domain-containing protein